MKHRALLLIFIVPIILLSSTFCSMAASFGGGSAVLTNPYMAWNIGAQFVFIGTGDAEGISLYYNCTSVESIRGVNCLKVEILDVGRADLGTYLWLAQDTAGNIWQLQQSDEQFDGSWETESGEWLIMPASFTLGESVVLSGPYSLDEYTVVSVTGTASTPCKTFSSCVVIELSEYGDVEQNFLAPDFGPVRITFSGSENGSFDLQSVSGFQPPQEVVLPDLRIAMSGAAIRISWDATESSVELVSCLSLANDLWATVPITPLADGDGWFVNLPVESGSRFFKLQKGD